MTERIARFVIFWFAVAYVVWVLNHLRQVFGAGALAGAFFLSLALAVPVWVARALGICDRPGTPPGDHYH